MNGLDAYGVLPNLFQIRNNILGRDQKVHFGNAVILSLYTPHLDLAVIVLRDVRYGLDALEQGRDLIGHVVDLVLQLRQAAFNVVNACCQHLHLLVDPIVDALDLLSNLGVDDAVVCFDSRCDSLLIGLGQFTLGRLDGFVNRRNLACQLLVCRGIPFGNGFLQQLYLGIDGRNVVVIGQLFVDPALHRGNTIVDGGRYG